jgi:hypothetical protein
MESSSGLMVGLIKEIGLMASSMGRESMLLHKEQKNMVNGKREKELDGLVEMKRGNEKKD